MPQRTFFAPEYLVQLSFLYLTEVQFYRGRAAQNLYCYLQAAFFVVDLLYYAAEVVEWTINYPDDFAWLEQHLRTRLLDTCRVGLEALPDHGRTARGPS